jgi:DNA-binding CsgD family transcriptional regulator
MMQLVVQESRSETRVWDQPMPLLEREDPIAVWDSLVAASYDGNGGTVLVTGPPGIGKSRLLDECADRSRGEGVRTLRATASDMEQKFPYGVVRQLLESTILGMDLTERDRVLSGAAAHAAPLILGEEVSANGDERKRDAATDVSRAHALFWVISNLAEHQPLSIVIDDAHWSDTESLTWLLYLARRIQDLPVALLVSMRAANCEQLQHLQSLDNTSEIELSSLSRESVKRLLSTWVYPNAVVDEAFANAFAESSGGNPFFIHELAKALLDEGLESRSANAQTVSTKAPPRVSQMLLLRLGDLSEQAQALARSLAVLGGSSTLPIAAEHADIELDDALAAATELTESSLVRPSEELTFSHPIVRQAIYDSISPLEQGEMHRRAAHIKQRYAVGVERVAMHLLHTSAAAGDDIVGTLREASRCAVERGAPQAAVTYLQRAAQEPNIGELRDVLLIELADVASRAGLPEAATYLKDAIEVVNEPHARGLLQRDLGKILFALGRFDDSVKVLDRAMAELPDGIDENLSLELEAGWAAAVIFTARMREDDVRGRIENMVAKSTVPQTDAQRIALSHLAAMEMWTGHNRQQAIDLALCAWGEGALLREAGCDEPSIWAITAALFGAEEYDKTIEVCEAVISEAQSFGSPLAFATANYVRAAVRMQQGRIVDALADVERALQSADEGWETFRASALAIRARCLYERGEVEEAQNSLVFAEDDEQRWERLLTFIPVWGMRGELKLIGNDPSGALDCFTKLGEVLTSYFGPNANPTFTTAWRSGSARAHAALGNLDEARRLSDEEIELARKWGSPRCLGHALRHRGRISGKAGVEWLEEAVKVLETSDAKLEHAHALVDLGTAMRAAGRRRDAHSILLLALDRADHAEALELAAKAREELAVLGARPRRARLTGARSLTPTELRVVQMAVDGMSNREIAEALFVTIHAVRFHLRNAYAKLGVETRDQLAGALAADR